MVPILSQPANGAHCVSIDYSNIIDLTSTFTHKREAASKWAKQYYRTGLES